MGQYQQWLFAQEIDRRLRAELETLETELFYLQDRITILEQVVPATENIILQALTVYLHEQDNQLQPPVEKPVPDQEIGPELAQAAPAPEVFSSPTRPDQETVPYLPRAYTQQEMSEDMLAFFDKRSQTDPRLSALLQRERQRASSLDGSAHPIDEETSRLNENIQRWFTRWHRQIEDVQAEEVENE